MGENIVLYDMRKKDYPNKRDDTFRTLQVFKCWVCGGLTNRVTMGGYPGYGVATICPNSSECWHHELYRKITWLKRHPHPKHYKEELQQEIDDEVKESAHLVVHDLVGAYDKTLVESASHVFSSKPNDRECRHLSHGSFE
ncbi:MAG: hypothetical protein HZA35_02375 [Parcubacteria group bacterium]|nr:hypothetical protein [Parcubacteria group bacterium]